MTGAAVGPVAFVGLGSMGDPMARRLIEQGFALQAFDVAPGRADALGELGARPAATAREAGEGAEWAVVMVATPEQAESAVGGPDGVAAGLAAGGTVIITSTIGPDAVGTLAAELEGRGLRLLDAPVSGNFRRAAAGELLILIGGPDELLAEARPVLDALGNNVVPCGPEIGDGQKVKLVNQLLCGVHIAAAAEALAYASRLGLDPRAAYEAIRHGAAASFMLEDRGQRMLAREFDPPRSSIDIFVKDMGLVVGAGAGAGASMPLAEAARRMFDTGAERGLGSEDDSVVLRIYEDPS